MKKKLLVLLLFSIIAIRALNAQSEVYYSWDFSDESSLNQFIQIDRDGNTPGEEAVLYGFAVGKAWVRYVLEDDFDNAVVMSTSSYRSENKKSNDWLITSQLDITSEKSILVWRGKSLNQDKRDSYEVYVSTTGTNIEDFDKIDPLFSTGNENFMWTEHRVSLSKYAGQKIYIAFVNISNDKMLLCLDDIQIVKGENYSMNVTIPERLPYSTEEVAITGEVGPLMGFLLKKFTVSCTVDGKTYTREYEDLNIKGGKRYKFELDEKIHLTQPGQSVSYSIIVTIGDIQLIKEGKVARASFNPVKRVVIEEGTGTWCSNCPRGIVRIREYKAKYGDQIVALAVHVNDPMAVNAYTNAMSGTYFKGYPEIIVNRRKNVERDPDKVVGVIEDILAEPVPASIKIAKASLSEDAKSIDVEANTTFAFDLDRTNYQIAFVLSENGVEGYKQQNIFSGGDMPMGGFEDLPSTVSIAFDDVARGIYDSFWGISGSIPRSVEKDVAMATNYTASVPGTIQKTSHLEMVAMLIDITTQEIINSDVIHVDDSATGIEDSVMSISERIDRENDAIIVTLESSDCQRAEVELINTQGVVVDKKWGSNGRIIVPTYNYKGVYILRVKMNDKIIVRKICL